jgi:hypothetical protein
VSRPKTRVCGPFLPDPDCGTDINRRGVCAVCHLPGQAGDAHHPLPDGPDDDGQRRAAGERTEGT